MHVPQAQFYCKYAHNTQPELQRAAPCNLLCGLNRQGILYLVQVSFIKHTHTHTHTHTFFLSFHINPKALICEKFLFI